MAFRDVNSNATDIKKYKDKPFQGIFKGFKNITTKIGAQVVYDFIGSNNMPFSIYGFTNLNRAMENVPVGAEVRITYLGVENCQTKFGMKDVHQVRVEVNEIDESEIEHEHRDDIPF